MDSTYSYVLVYIVPFHAFTAFLFYLLLERYGPYILNEILCILRDYAGKLYTHAYVNTFDLFSNSHIQGDPKVPPMEALIKTTILSATQTIFGTNKVHHVPDTNSKRS